MPPSTPTGGKRRRGGSYSRGRKKQKRLDAIHDVVPPPPPAPADCGESESDAEALRRSTRMRRAPVVLDTSPLPSHRRKRPRGGGESGASGSSQRRPMGRKQEVASRVREVEVGGVMWRSRLRDRVKGKAKLKKRGRSLWFEEEEEVSTVVVDVREGSEEDERGGLQSQGREVRDTEINLTIDLNVDAPESVDDDALLEEEEEEEEGEKEEEEEEEAISPENDLEEADEVEEEVKEEEGLREEAKHEESKSPVIGGVNDDELACDEKNEEDGSWNIGENEHLEMHKERTAEETSPVEQELQEDCCGSGEQVGEVQPDESMDDIQNVVLADEAPKEREGKSPVSDEKRGALEVKEGRRCGLCGGGTDGRPPKVAVQDSADSENEAYEGALASEEPNYDVWDGFGDDPGWLGRLLGPIHDRFGIARVWVHQNCAVWSPEVCA